MILFKAILKRNDLKEIKTKLGKLGAKLQSEKKVDALITEYIFVVRGNAYNRRYMNIALRNWTEAEINRLLGLEYKIVEAGKKMSKIM